MTEIQDTLGKPIHVGDDVRVAAYGYGARLGDCGRVGTVVRLARSRAVVHFPQGEDVRNISGRCLMVQEGKR